MADRERGFFRPPPALENAVLQDQRLWLARTDFVGVHEGIEVDGRRILRREAMKGIELLVLGG